jgi:serine/threonine protein kinase
MSAKRPENTQAQDAQHTVDFVNTDASPHVADATIGFQTTGRTVPELSPAPADSPSIPGYAITAEIAKGGMGRIYAARDLTLQREVAIKTLLPGANEARFVIESKITAQLPHPCIPPIYALGTLQCGTPFLAMKFIRGRTLADELAARLNPKEQVPRFVLIFEQIAQAVGFAHSRNIIHRDLKPLNVMVGEFGEVQVMDWGLAKKLFQNEAYPEESVSPTLRSGDQPTRTLAGAVMGTPGYMAPEQARGENVDTRADVFALGAILGAILTGQPAFVGTTILESIQLAASGKLDDVYSRLDECGQDPELIAIAKRCMAVDRAERPPDGQAVAAEVAAYRAGVEARLRRSETEKVEALVREGEERKRRKQLFTAAATVSVTLLAGLTASVWQMRRAIIAEQSAVSNAEDARRERDAKEQARLAEQQRAEGEQIAKLQAEKNLDFARRGNEVLQSVFKSLDPAAEYKTIAELRNALSTNVQKAIGNIEGTSLGEPLAVAELQDTLGQSLLGLGESAESIEVLQRAVATRVTLLGDTDPKTIRSKGHLAESYRAAGMIDKALPLYEETLRSANERFGPNHKDTLASKNNLAVGYHAAGMLDKALPLYEELLATRRAELGTEHEDTLASMSNLAAAYFSRGEFDRAVPLYEETCQTMKRTLGSDHLSTLTSMNNLGAVYFKSGAFEKGVPLFAESLELRRQKLGPDHPETLATMRNLGIAYCKTDQGEDAAKILGEFIDRQRANHNQDDPQFASLLAINANDLIICKQYAAAEAMLRDCLAIREATMPDNWSTFNTRSVLGGALMGQGKLAEAESYLVQGYEGMKAREKDIPPAAATRIPESLDRLIEFYNTIQKDESKLNYLSERAKYPNPPSQ